MRFPSFYAETKDLIGPLKAFNLSLLSKKQGPLMLAYLTLSSNQYCAFAGMSLRLKAMSRRWKSFRELVTFPEEASVSLDKSEWRGMPGIEGMPGCHYGNACCEDTHTHFPTTIHKTPGTILKTSRGNGQSVLTQTHMFSPSELVPNRGYGWGLFVGRKIGWCGPGDLGWGSLAFTDL